MAEAREQLIFEIRAEMSAAQQAFEQLADASLKAFARMQGGYAELKKQHDLFVQELERINQLEAQAQAKHAAGTESVSGARQTLGQQYDLARGAVQQEAEQQLKALAEQYKQLMAAELQAAQEAQKSAETLTRSYEAAQQEIAKVTTALVSAAASVAKAREALAQLDAQQEKARAATKAQENDLQRAMETYSRYAEAVGQGFADVLLKMEALQKRANELRAIVDERQAKGISTVGQEQRGSRTVTVDYAAELAKTEAALQKLQGTYEQLQLRQQNYQQKAIEAEQKLAQVKAQAEQSEESYAAKRTAMVQQVEQEEQKLAQLQAEISKTDEGQVAVARAVAEQRRQEAEQATQEAQARKTLLEQTVAAYNQEQQALAASGKSQAEIVDQTIAGLTKVREALTAQQEAEQRAAAARAAADAAAQEADQKQAQLAEQYARQRIAYEQQIADAHANIGKLEYQQELQASQITAARAAREAQLFVEQQAAERVLLELQNQLNAEYAKEQEYIEASTNALAHSADIIKQNITNFGVAAQQVANTLVRNDQLQQAGENAGRVFASAAIVAAATLLGGPAGFGASLALVLKAGGKDLILAARDVASQIVDVLQSVLVGPGKQLVTAYVDHWKTQFEALKQAVTPKLNEIKDAIGKMLDEAKSAVSSRFDAIKNTVTAKLSEIKNAIASSDAFKALSGATSSAASTVGGAAGSVADKLGDVFGPLASKVGDVVGPIFSKVSEFAQKAFSEVSSFAQKAFSAIGSFGGQVFGALGDAAKASAGAIGAAFGAAVPILTGVFNGIKETLGGVFDTVKALGQTISGLVQTVGGYVQTFLQWSQQTAQQALSIRNLAAETGTSLDIASKLSAVFQVLGGSEYNIATALDQVIEKAGENAAAFERLGVATRDVNGNLLSGSTILINLAQSYENAANKTNFLANVTQLFSPKFMTALLPVITLGSDGLKRLMTEMQQVGLVMDQEMVQRGTRVSSALGLMGEAFNQLRNALVTSFEPAIVALTQLLLQALPKALELIAELGTRVANILSGIFSAFGGSGVAKQVQDIINALVLKPNTGTTNVPTGGRPASQAPEMLELTQLQKQLELAIKGANSATDEQKQKIKELTGVDLEQIATLNQLKEAQKQLGQEIKNVKAEYAAMEAPVKAALKEAQNEVKNLENAYKAARDAQQEVIHGLEQQRQAVIDQENAAIKPLQTQLDGVNAQLKAIQANENKLLAPLEEQIAELTPQLDQLKEQLRQALLPLQQQESALNTQKQQIEDEIKVQIDPLIEAKDVAEAELQALQAQEKAATQAIQDKIETDKQLLDALQAKEEDALAPYEAQLERIRSQIDAIKSAEEDALAPFDEAKQKLQDQLDEIQSQIDEIQSNAGQTPTIDQSIIDQAQQSAAEKVQAALDALTAAQQKATEASQTYADAQATLAEKQQELSSINLAQADSLRALVAQDEARLALLEEIGKQQEANARNDENALRIQELEGSNALGALERQKQQLQYEQTLGKRQAGETPEEYQRRIQMAQLDQQIQQQKDLDEINKIRDQATRQRAADELAEEKAQIQERIKLNTDAASKIEQAYKTALSEVASAEKALESAEKALATATADVTAKQDALAKAQTAAAQEIAKAQEQAVKAAGQLSDADQLRIKALQQQEKQLQAQEKQLDRNRRLVQEQYDAQLKALEAQEKATQGAEQGVKAQYDAQIKAAQAQLKSDEAALQAAQAQFEPKIKQLQAEISNYDAQMTAIKAKYQPELDRITTQLDALKLQEDQIKNQYQPQIDALQTQITGIQAQETAIRDQANAQSAGLKSQQQELESQIENIKTQFQPQIDSFNQQIEDAQKQLQQIEDTYTPQINAAQSRVSALQDQLNNLQEEEQQVLEPLQQQYDDLTTKIGDLEQQANDAKTTLSELIEKQKEGIQGITGEDYAALGVKDGTDYIDGFMKGLEEGQKHGSGDFGFGQTIGTFINQLMTDPGGTIGEAMGKLGGFLKEKLLHDLPHMIGEELGNPSFWKEAIGLAAKIIEIPFDVVASLIQGIVDEIVKGVGGPNSPIGEIVRAIFQPFTDPHALEVMFFTGGPLGVAAGYAMTFLGFLKDHFLPSDQDVLELGKNIVNGIIEVFKNPGKYLGEIGSALGGFKDWIVGGFKHLFGIHSPSQVTQDEVGKPIVEGILDGMKDKWNDITSWLGGLKDKVIDGIKKPGELTGWLVDHGKDILSGLHKGATGVWDDTIAPYLGQRKDEFVKNLKAGVEFTGWLLDKGKDIFTGLHNGVTNVWDNDIKPWAGKFKDTYIQVLKTEIEFPKWLFDHGKDVFTGLFNGIKHTWENDIQPWLGRFKDELVKALKGPVDFVEWLVEHGKSIFTGLLNGVKNVFEDAGEKTGITGFLTKLPDHIKGFFSNANTWLEDAGKGLINGFKNGMGDVGAAIWNTFRPGAQAAIDKIVDFVNLIIGGIDTLSSKFGINIPKLKKEDFQLPGPIGGGSPTQGGYGSPSGGEMSFYASGTASANAGLALVGEMGPELVVLPRGAAVIPNHVLTAAIGSPAAARELIAGLTGAPRFFGGGIFDPGSWIKAAEGALGAIADLPGDLGDAVKKAIAAGPGKILAEALRGIQLPDLSPFLPDDFPLKFIGTLIANAGNAIKEAIGGGGGRVQLANEAQIIEWIREAMKITGIGDESWIPGLLTIIGWESSGNVYARNHDPRDDKPPPASDPVGLMQVKEYNFPPGTPEWKMFDPVTNISYGLIRIRDAHHNSPYNIPGVATGDHQAFIANGGYAAGGIAGLMGPELALLGERGPELVVPAEVTQALRAQGVVSFTPGNFAAALRPLLNAPTTAASTRSWTINQTLVLAGRERRTRAQELAEARMMTEAVLQRAALMG